MVSIRRTRAAVERDVRYTLGASPLTSRLQGWIGLVGASWVVIAVATIIALVWGWYLYGHAFVPDGDTQLLVSSSHIVWACVEQRVMPCDGVAQFAILQNIPAIIGVALGKTDDTIYRVLSLGSVLAIAALTLLTGLVGRRVGGALGATLGAAIVLSGPFIYYDATTWGEPVAALFLALPIVALIFRWNLGLVVVASTLAAITKDIAPVTIILLSGAILAARFGTDERAVTLRRAIAVVAGSMLGAVLQAGFNYFRYGVFHNVFYIDLSPRPPVGFIGKAFGAVWFSPSGGVIPYWPSMFVLLIVLAMSVLAIRAASWNMRVAHLALLAAAVVNTMILASFVAPFGWIAWGPRLMLPWLLPALFVGVILHRQLLAHWWVGLLRMWAVMIPLAAIVAATGVYINAAARFSGGWLVFFAPRSSADPYCSTPVFWDKPRAYFDCIGSLLWDRNGPIVLLRDQLPATASNVALVLTMVVVGFVVAGLSWAVAADRCR